MPLQVLLILIVLALLWVPTLMHPAAVQSSGAVLFDLLASALGGAPLAGVILAIVLVAVEGLLLNIVLANAGLVPQTSLLPTLLYVCAASATCTTLEPSHLVNLLLIGCIQQLTLHETALSISTRKICNVGAMIGLCSMLSLPAAAIFISYIFIAISYRLYNWRDWASYLLGFAAPYTILVGIEAYRGSLATTFATIWSNLASFSPTISATATVDFLANIVFSLVMLAALIASMGKMQEHNVLWQKNAQMVMLFVIGAFAALLYVGLLPVCTALFAVVFALCGTIMLLPSRHHLLVSPKRKRAWINDALLLLTIVAALLC